MSSLTDRDGLAIEATDLTKVYKDGVKANDQLNINVRRGQVYGLLGPNGAGKSTFVQQVLGLIEPTAGSVEVFGANPVHDPDTVKRMIGYLPQTTFAMRDLYAEEAIYFTGRLKGLSHREAIEQREHLFSVFDLEEIRGKAVFQASGGMQRMAGFVAALLGHPRLLVLDEPTNDLDPLRRRAVWDMIRRVVNEDGATCLLVTHNVLEAERVVDRVALINDGRVVAEGTPGKLKERLGESLRVEAWLREDGELAAEQLTDLSALGILRQPRPHQLSILVPLDGVGTTVDRVLATIGLEQIDDFRVATASLEDVYVELVGRSIADDDAEVAAAALPDEAPVAAG